MMKNSKLKLITNEVANAPAQAMLAVNHPNIGTGVFSVNNNRPFLDNEGNSLIVINEQGHTFHTNVPATLQYEEWLDIDRTVTKVATDRLVGWASLIAKGLIHRLGSIGHSVSLWDKESDMTPAEASMSGVTQGEKDRPAYQTESVAIPVIHKEFSLNLRNLEASRTFGSSLDTTSTVIATRKVAEKTEDMLYLGLDNIKVGEARVYGYTTFPDRNNVILATPWDDLSVEDNKNILDDVGAMIAACRADNYRGPFSLEVPREWEGKLDEDYRQEGDNRTVRDRILQLTGISDVLVADRLPTDEAILIQKTSDVIDVAIGQDITAMQWAHNGGMVQNFSVMAIWAPRLKSDYDGRMGLAHLKAA